MKLDPASYAGREYILRHLKNNIGLTQIDYHDSSAASPETSTQKTPAAATSTEITARSADSSTEIQSSQDFKQSDNPYAVKLKPDDVSDDVWYKKLEDDFQAIKPKAMALVKKYKAMGVADVFDRNAPSDPEAAKYAPPDAADRWEIANMDAALAKKVNNEGFVLTDDERECFQFSAACEWVRDHYKSKATQAQAGGAQTVQKGMVLDTDA